jgi:hypothetical protein
MNYASLYEIADEHLTEYRLTIALLKAIEDEVLEKALNKERESGHTKVR